MIPVLNSYGLIITMLLFMLAQSSRAGDSNKYIHYACDQLQGRITISYKNSDYEMNIADRNSHISHYWNLWELVSTDESNEVIIGLHTIEKTCVLKEQTYSILFRPVPGNSNIFGRCGSFITAAVTIVKNGKVIEDRQFEADCQDINTPIITKLVIKAEDKLPQIETTSWYDFYKE